MFFYVFFYYVYLSSRLTYATVRSYTKICHFSPTLKLADDVSLKVVHNKSRGKGSAGNYHPTPFPSTRRPGAKEHSNMSNFSSVSYICIAQNRIPQSHGCNIWETYSGKQNASSVYSVRLFTVLCLH